MLLSLLLLTAAPDAQAANNQPFMWAGGATLSTIAFPGAFPLEYPKATNDGDPNPRNNLERVKADLGIGARGLLYLNNKNRIGARLNLGFGLGGADMRSTVFTLEYEQSIFRQDNINVFVGGGIGVGSLRFNQGSEGGDLRTNTYNTRLQAAIIYRDTQGKKKAADDRAYELALFATPIGFNGPETYEFGNTTVEDPESYSLFAGLTGDESDDQALKGSRYNPTVGIEATIFFGDLTPPSSGKNKKKKNNTR